MNIRKQKIAKFAVGIAVIVLGGWLYRISEYESRNRAHGQCEMEAQRLYLKEQENLDTDTNIDSGAAYVSLSDALYRNFASYVDACMGAGGYGRSYSDWCDPKDSKIPLEFALHAYKADCYAPDDLMQHLMIKVGIP